jgi:hypothetical protein
MIYYTFFFFGLTFKKKRIEVQTTNKKLDEMRKISIKTLDEQKQFINTKYPKPKKFKFTWMWLGKIIVVILIALLLFRAYNLFFKYLGVTFKLWHVILIVILFPIIVNLGLKIFHLEKDDLTAYIR